MHVGRQNLRECPGVFKRRIIMLQARTLWIARNILDPKSSSVSVWISQRRNCVAVPPVVRTACCCPETWVMPRASKNAHA